jgi:hypothetical protein
LPSPPNPSVSGGRNSARVKALHAAADSDVIADEIFLATDSRGRKHLTMNGALPADRVERLFWIVDTNSSEYRLIRLTGNPQGDARCISAVYRRLGVVVDAGAIAPLLDESPRLRDALEQRDRGRRVAVGPLRQPLGPATPSEARTVSAAFSTRDHQAALTIADRRLSCDGGATTVPVARPAVNRDPAHFAVRPAQWASSCNGSGWAMVQTWEPAKYLFPVDHLNETYSEAQWSAYNGALTSASGNGYCWANPQTFANTHWLLEGCYTSGGVGDFAGLHQDGVLQEL